MCVWYQCQGVSFCAQPAVSLNNPTCLGPWVIHSLSGNLHCHGEIKKKVWVEGVAVIGGRGWGVYMMKHCNLVDSAYCGRRIPLIKQPLLSWRAVYREGEWGKSCAGCFEEAGLLLDSDTHNNMSARLCSQLTRNQMFLVLGKCGMPLICDSPLTTFS